MCTYLLLVLLAVITLMGVCVNATNIKISEGDAPCCPGNSTLKCCCERYIPYYQASSAKANWYTADLLCKESGMDLAIITSDAEEKALTAYLTSISSAVGVGAGYWIGASNLGLTNYYWIKTGTQMLYNAFVPGQPDNPGSENCVQWLISQPGVTGWNNYGCNSQILYVCQSRRGCI